MIQIKILNQAQKFGGDARAFRFQNAANRKWFQRVTVKLRIAIPTWPLAAHAESSCGARITRDRRSGDAKASSKIEEKCHGPTSALTA
ncbi:hypothetical protein WG901_08740 [Novosphingobium sp. PS1R-30]|uniref:Uncharacterized protein n=1 Tax=Novosphingobium anseongense TaxID=3133436 RepID=A0ABU8RUQ5_9SPHN